LRKKVGRRPPVSIRKLLFSGKIWVFFFSLFLYNFKARRKPLFIHARRLVKLNLVKICETPPANLVFIEFIWIVGWLTFYALIMIVLKKTFHCRSVFEFQHYPRFCKSGVRKPQKPRMIYQVAILFFHIVSWCCRNLPMHFAILFFHLINYLLLFSVVLISSDIFHIVSWYCDCASSESYFCTRLIPSNHLQHLQTLMTDW